ncbi:MAG: hypothetical protein OER22_01740 [Gammaproteobacteria bacterium]|nr:hypothetical protein [Gammaproteobacteria bacterium]MDH3372683.1 hypothetical protein [Gammaproteobacteria bacterium]MDH3408062.1 hypothetical protein [Gammaproteobacteria bacterium]MDH3551315.1 hypothetical protein [Gammaproteobacteria bacterium]
MPSETTLFTRDGNWKAEVEAWKNNFLFYKSIGCQVTVYHREETKNVWGNTSTDWVKRAADSIFIRNRYSGSGPGVATREKTCNEASYCELKEWAVGITVTIPPDGIDDVGGGAILEIDSVDSSVSVRIERETLTGEVSASSAFGDSSIW